MNNKPLTLKVPNCSPNSNIWKWITSISAKWMENYVLHPAIPWSLLSVWIAPTRPHPFLSSWYWSDWSRPGSGSLPPAGEQSPNAPSASCVSVPPLPPLESAGPASAEPETRWVGCCNPPDATPIQPLMAAVKVGCWMRALERSELETIPMSFETGWWRHAMDCHRSRRWSPHCCPSCQSQASAGRCCKQRFRTIVSSKGTV